jgi:hypothetical protein
VRCRGLKGRRLSFGMIGGLVVLSGATITVLSDRDWTITGTLAGSSIKGTMSVTSSKKVLGPEGWVRDVRLREAKLLRSGSALPPTG